jgi:hypothetical protein
MRTRIFFALLSSVILLGCNAIAGIFSSSKTVDETPTSVDVPSATDEDIPINVQPCDISPGNPTLDHATSFTGIPTAINDYLSAGGAIDNLIAVLETMNMATPFSPQYVVGDFTGDGWKDVVLILLDPEPEFMMPSGTLIIYQCQVSHYNIVYQSTITEEVNVPIIYSTEDLNSDMQNDVLVGFQSCGAHTCFERLELLSWQGTTMENIMGGSSSDIPTPSIEVIPDENEIKVTAQGIGSAGAGPFRRFTRSWIWNPETGGFLPTPDDFLPSPFRIHLLLDADQFVKDRSYDRALDFYVRVIEDDGLQDWGDPEYERATLGAYASFRLIHTHLLLADSESAEIAYTKLISNYPPGTIGYDFAQMGDDFWNQYRSTTDIISACVTAQAFAFSHQETIIDALYFGYANPTYTVEDICPTFN